MFNDLNNPNTSRRPAVDDIFAETDKTSVGGPQSDIETHRVGLVATGENLPPIETEQVSGGSKKFKIIIIVVVALVVLGGAYFTYSQFLATKPTEVDLNANPKVDIPKTAATTTTPAKTTDSGFVPVVPGTAVSTSTNNPSEPATTSPATTTIPEIPVESTVDSDNDGLTDVEEKISGTNVNVIDTDNDGLSDYEEVKIYRTNPLSADTDGDSYLDGAEVKGGYNPNGPGKLSGN